MEVEGAAAKNPSTLIKVVAVTMMSGSILIAELTNNIKTIHSTELGLTLAPKGESLVEKLSMPELLPGQGHGIKQQSLLGAEEVREEQVIYPE
jgi:hypothetical protein